MNGETKSAFFTWHNMQMKRKVNAIEIGLNAEKKENSISDLYIIQMRNISNEITN